jgi:serine/threonine-protein kinase HipA
MGRRSHSRALGVWANGMCVGRWLVPAAGTDEFLYDAEWTASPQARPLSLSLPMNLEGLAIRGEKVGFFFDNLLPDSEAIRARVRARFHTRSGDAIDLLSAIGRDCIGAWQLLPEGERPARATSIDVTPLSEAEVERELLRTSNGSLPGVDFDDDFRISIAGAQEKTALTRHQGQWCRPRGATPTTHIFKLPLGLIGGQKLDLRESLENEWLCSKLLSAFGVAVSSCEVRTFGHTKALVVERFDRRLHPSGKHWLRLPQEDFCQVMGKPSSQKYEADGGPSLVAIAQVLQGSTTRSEDLATLLRAQLLFWMLAATDGHAKNLSIHLLPQGHYRLTPLYDVLSAWPVVGAKHNQIHPKKLRLAMALRGRHAHYHLEEIDRRLFNHVAHRCGYGLDMEDLIESVIAQTPKVIDQVGASLPNGFPEGLFAAVTKGLLAAQRRLAAMPAR